MTPENEKAWEGLVKEADPCTAAGCGRLIHGHYKVEWEIACRKAILAADAELDRLRAQLDSTRADLREGFKTIAKIQDENDRLREEVGRLGRLIEAIEGASFWSTPKILDPDADGQTYITLGEFMDRRRAAMTRERDWISIKDKLPGPFVPVVLLNIDCHEMHGDYGDPATRVYSDVGFLNNSSSLRHWSIRGQRAVDVSAYTHWMPLPPPPTKRGKAQ